MKINDLFRSSAQRRFARGLLYFRPGEHTDMHYHLSPETFLVLEGKASVKGLKGEDRIIGEKRDRIFRRQRLLPDHQRRH